MSAGGQLEQPSEVKSSMRTGVALVVSAAAVLFSPCEPRALRAGATFKDKRRIRDVHTNDSAEPPRDIAAILSEYGGSVGAGIAEAVGRRHRRRRGSDDTICARNFAGVETRPEVPCGKRIDSEKQRC